MAVTQPSRFIDGPPMLIAGLRRVHGFADAGRSIRAQWDEFRRLPLPPGAVAGVTYGVICGATADGFEYMSGIEVADFGALAAGTGRMRIPAQRYAVFGYHGPAAGLQELWRQIMQEWLPQSGFRSAERPDFERYDGRFDPDARAGVVEIWLGIAR